ncbi:MAG: ribonuclease H-like domain-containing protein [Desulfovibrionales bacterium]
MLQNSFCHLPGIGPKKERRLWSEGVSNWNDLLAQTLSSGLSKSFRRIVPLIEESALQLSSGNAEYFAEAFSPSSAWRLFSEFKDHVAYVDIETTGGMGMDGDHITAIGLYNGREVRTYVHGLNLEEFEEDIFAYKLLVTFNGRCFDVPVLERHFRMKLPRAHIDLRYVLAALGYKGGLKKCEQHFGLGRGDLDGVDGFFAVLLWNEFDRTGDDRILETLLSYNVADILSLEILLHQAFNLGVEQTPFCRELSLPVPELAENPHAAHPDVVARIRENLNSASVPRWF